MEIGCQLPHLELDKIYNETLFLIFYELCIRAAIIHSKLLVGKTRRIFGLPDPHLSSCLFLALIYAMGLATPVSIQLDLSHRSPNKI